MAVPTVADWIRGLEQGAAGAPFRDARAALEARIGRLLVDRYLQLVFDHLHTKVFPGKNARSFYRDATSPTWRAGIEAALDHELRTIDGRIELHDELLDRARRGQLAVTSIRAEPEASYVTLPSSVPAQLAAYDKAAQWIAKGSRNKDLDRRKYIAALQTTTVPLPAGVDTIDKVQDLRLRPSDFGDRTLVRMVHRGVYGLSLPSLRFGQPINYPSTVGGGFLVDRLFAGPPFPSQSMRPQDFWTNWALYFAATIGAAQAFEDGNKRTVHAYYAAIVLQTLGTFVAPKASFEARLFAMT